MKSEPLRWWTAEELRQWREQAAFHAPSGAKPVIVCFVCAKGPLDGVAVRRIRPFGRFVCGGGGGHSRVERRKAMAKLMGEAT